MPTPPPYSSSDVPQDLTHSGSSEFLVTHLVEMNSEVHQHR